MNQYKESRIKFFQDHIQKSDDCWEWMAYKDPAGYGRMSYNGKPIYAHRFSKSLLEPLIKGLEIDHLCRNRGCVNPDHLEQVTHRVNTFRSPIHIIANPELNPNRNRDASLCLKGHPYSHTSYGKICRVCNRIKQAKYKLNNYERLKYKNRVYMREYMKMYNRKKKLVP